MNILNYGFNYMGDETNPGIHAEADALDKLKTNENKKKPIAVNMLVIRMSKTNVLQSSKPCANCIEKLKYIPDKKGYYLQDIYYSSSDQIIHTKLHILDIDEKKHYSRYARNFIN